MQLYYLRLRTDPFWVQSSLGSPAHTHTVEVIPSEMSFRDLLWAQQVGELTTRIQSGLYVVDIALGQTDAKQGLFGSKPVHSMVDTVCSELGWNSSAAKRAQSWNILCLFSTFSPKLEID